MTKEAIIIDGKKISEQMLANLKNRIETDNISAKLAIILVGEDASSKIYVQNKIKSGLKVGIQTELKTFASHVTEEELLHKIKELNEDPDISGIIVQMPLPDHINKFNVIMAVDPMKDVDGFHPINLGKLFSPYKNGFVPCTARGCLDLIKHCTSDLSGKNIVIIGRSNIVGRPLAALLLKEDCTVTICHSRTKNLAEITYKADIVVSAMGKAQFLTTDYFNSNAIIIDVGINRIENNGKYKLSGDVDFQTVKNHVKYITPVPGGVGPMTVAYLLLNTYAAKIGLDNL